MNLISRYATAGLVSVLLVACAEKSADEYIAAAKGYVAEGDYPSALIELRSAAQQEPGSGEVRYHLAKLSLAAGDSATAEKEAQMALDRGIDAGRAQPLLVEALFRQRKLDEAVEAGRTLADGASDADRALIMGLVGQGLLSQLDYPGAEQLFELALEIDPDSIEPMVGLSALARLSNDNEGARRWAEKARDANPESARAWGVLGDIESMEGRREAALESFDRAVELSTYVGMDHVKRTHMRVLLQQYDEAEAELARLRQSGLKGHWYVDHVQGMLDFYRGKYPEAVENFTHAVNKWPISTESKVYAAIAQARLGRFEEALSQARQVSRDLPGSMQSKRLLGSVLVSMGDYEGAREVLLELEQQDPENLYVLQLLATINLYEGNMPEAQGYARRLLELSPESAEAQNLLMVSTLLKGEDLQALGGDVLQSQDPYTRQQWVAVSEFKQGRVLSAREKAQALREQYPDEVDPQSLLASTYLAVGEWDQARRELKGVLELDENNATALMNLAKLELITDNPAEVEGWLNRVLEAYPRRADVALFAGDMFLRLERADRALEVLATGVAAQPDNPALRLALMRQHYARADYDAVIQLAENLPEAQLAAEPQILEVTALSHAKKSNYPLASATFDKLVRLQPDSARAYLNYADVLVVAGEPKRAEAAFRKALTLDPANVVINTEFVEFLARNGDMDAAREVLVAATELNEESAVLIGYQGWVDLLDKQYPSAAEKLAQAQAIQPDSARLVLLARALVYQQKNEEALAVIDDWLEDYPQDQNVLLHKAGLFLAQGDEERALQAYRDVLVVYPEHVPSLNNAAWLSRKMDTEGALELSRQALALRPRDPYVLDTLGNIETLAGELPAALEHLQLAAQLAPADYQIQLHLAALLVRMDKNEEARALLETIVSSAGDSEHAREARGLLAELQ